MAASLSAIPIVFYPVPKFQADRYHEVHPYGPVTNNNVIDFEHTLGVDVTTDGPVPALAVMEGMVRVISVGGSTASLILKPLKQIPQILNGSVVFVYHNLKIADIRAKLGPTIEEQAREIAEKIMIGAEPSQYVDYFTEGKFALRVPAGQQLGALDDTGRNDDRALLEFEIVYTTGGALGESWWKRLEELVDVGRHKTRRLDPATFYTRAEAAAGLVQITPEHVDHPLVSRLTRRTLIELRDEYDEPLTGEVELTKNQQPSTITLDSLQWSTIVAAEIPPDVSSTHQPVTGAYQLKRDHCTLSKLPTSSQDERFPQQSLSTPEHWALQSIYMADRDDAASWFPAPDSSMQRFTARNKVTPLVDGVSAFRRVTAGYSEMYAVLKGLDLRDPFLRFAAWSMDNDVVLIPNDAGSRFRSLLQSIAQAGTEIRMLVWQSRAGGAYKSVTRASTAEVDQFSGDVHALSDGHTMEEQLALGPITRPEKVGSHHQKLSVMKAQGGTVAFCGGMDVWPDRLDTSEHNGFSDEPYHDVHAKIEGPAVVDLNKTFVQRWNNHPVRNGEGRPELPTSDPPINQDAGSHYVQVTRTFPSKGDLFPFALNGDFGTLGSVRRAIQRAQRYIYLEDQYAVPYDGPIPFDANEDSLGVLTDLVAALQRIEYLIIVVPNHITVPVSDLYRYRFFKALRDAAPDKVFVYYLQQAGDAAASSGEPEGDIEAPVPIYLPDDLPQAQSIMHSTPSGQGKYKHEIYVHSKVWIVDDVYAKIGSANCNRRSFTCDTEADIHVIDGAVHDGARRDVRAFRERLWGEHLGFWGCGNAVRGNELADPTHALHFWKNPPRGAHIAPYDVERGKSDPDNRFTQRLWRQVIDPDGR